MTPLLPSFEVYLFSGSLRRADANKGSAHMAGAGTGAVGGAGHSTCFVGCFCFVCMFPHPRDLGCRGFPFAGSLQPPAHLLSGPTIRTSRFRSTSCRFTSILPLSPQPNEPGVATPSAPRKHCGRTGRLATGTAMFSTVSLETAKSLPPTTSPVCVCCWLCVFTNHRENTFGNWISHRSLTRQRCVGPVVPGVRLWAVPYPLLPFPMEKSVTSSAVTSPEVVERKMSAPIVLRPHRWQFWRKPRVVNISLLAQQIDLEEELFSVLLRERQHQSRLAEFQQRTDSDRKAMSTWRKMFRKVEWASEPTRTKPRVIPGLGLELGLIAHALLLGVAHIVW